MSAAYTAQYNDTFCVHLLSVELYMHIFMCIAYANKKLPPGIIPGPALHHAAVGNDDDRYNDRSI